MKFNQSQISEIIQMAWDDQTDFSQIKKIYEINEGDVKKLWKKILNKKAMKFGEREFTKEVPKRHN